MSSYNLQMALLGFDKGGNPVRFRDLPSEKTNPNKAAEWHPCLFDGDEFVGPVWVKAIEHPFKATLLDAKRLVRMRSWSWYIDEENASEERRHVGVARFHRMFVDLDGEKKLVPKLPVLETDLHKIKW